MDLKLLKTFQMVAMLNSFSRTARTLDYAQSTITAHIQTLEEQMGTPLFNRVGKHIELTEAGKRLLTYAEQLLNLASETRRAVGGDGIADGTLTIGAPETVSTYRLPAILRRFREAMPGVRIIFVPVPHQELFQRVIDGTIDIIYLLERNITSESLYVETIACDRLLMIAAPDHPLADQESISLLDLQDEAFLLTERSCGYRMVFERALMEAGLFRNLKMEFNSVESIKQFVMAGMGIGFLPEIAVHQEIERGDLVVLPYRQQDFEIKTLMLWHRNKWISEAMQALLDLSQGTTVHS